MDARKLFYQADRALPRVTRKPGGGWHLSNGETFRVKSDAVEARRDAIIQRMAESAPFGLSDVHLRRGDLPSFMEQAFIRSFIKAGCLPP